eukprot:EG_transcript_9177
MSVDATAAPPARMQSARSASSSAATRTRSVSRSGSEVRSRSSPRPSIASRKKALTKVQQGHPAFFQMVLMQSAVEDCLLVAKFSAADRVVHGLPHMQPPDKAKEAAKHLQLTHHHPHLYKALRAHFDVDIDDYFRAVCCTHWQLLREGSTTFLAGDRYTVSLIGKKQSQLLADVAEDYHKYVTTNRQSALPRLLGHHTAEIEGRDLHFVVCETLLRLDRPVTRAFQLSHDSDFKPQPLPESGITSMADPRIVVGPQLKDALLTQLKRDTDFLKERKMSKYALEVGLQLSLAGDPPSGWQAQGSERGFFKVGINGILNGVPALSTKLFGPKSHAKKLYAAAEGLVA